MNETHPLLQDLELCNCSKRIELAHRILCTTTSSNKKKGQTADSQRISFVPLRSLRRRLE